MDNTFESEFDELPLILADGIGVGLFEGRFRAENGAISTIILYGWKWAFSAAGRYDQHKRAIEITSASPLWSLLCESIYDSYSDEIEAHRIGTHEAI